MNKCYSMLRYQLLIFSLLFSLFAPPVFAGEQDKTYVFGIVPQFEANKLRVIWQPIINYLKAETGYKFTIKGSPSINDFENEFMRGDYDFSYMNPFHIMLANSKVGYVPLVRDVGENLHGVLVVKKGSGITDVSQLDGRIIAFPSPNALGASLKMRQELIDVYNLKIIPRYVKTHDSVYLNVLLGEVAAGGGVQKTLNQQRADYRAELQVIYKTRSVAPHPIAAHPRVPDKVVAAVTTALLKLGETTGGKLLLSKIPMKKIGQATMQDYLPLKELGLERFYVK